MVEIDEFRVSNLRLTRSVATCSYPVNSMISLDDGTTEMAVVTDVTMGGSSMRDGSLEVMTHRRLTHDDHRGVGEPLDEVHPSFVHLCVAPLCIFSASH
eukprot:COSAG02_NODE_7_length_64539_cov_120.393482_49_plen_99_part_00